VLPAGPLWISATGDTPYYRLRRAIGSAEAAGAGPIWVSLAGGTEAFVMAEAHKVPLRFRCDAPIPVVGVSPRVTLSIQTSREGTWVLGASTFLAEVDEAGAHAAIDGLGPECLVGGCEVLAEPVRAECNAVSDADVVPRVRLGGEHGCLSPIFRKGVELSAFRADLGESVSRLGLGDGEPLIVSPEARVSVEVVLAVLGAFVDRGLPAPALAQPLVEGNDGPPLCTAEVTDAAGLDRAAAKWWGASVRAAQIAAAPDQAPGVAPGIPLPDGAPK
jgi:hypothetical protein